MRTPLPPYLKPKDTELPAGPDDSLEPSEPPTDSSARGLAPFVWPLVDASRGSEGPPDAPLAPPAVDPARRSAPPSQWPPELPGTPPNRPVELAVPVPDLDPDIAMWPETIVNRWPFTGPPTVGIWPRGWLGVDNTATLWVCTVAGQPGTWASLGGAGVLTKWGAASTSQFSGSGSPVGAVTPSGEGDLYVDTFTPALWQATGLTSSSWQLVGPAQGSGSPVGVVTPRAEGNLYIDTTTPGLWQATGLTSSSWEQLAALPLVTHSANLGNVSVPTSPAALFTVPVTVGTWLVNASGFDSVNATFADTYTVIQGTATATISGQYFATVGPNTAGGNGQGWAICAVAVVTVAGSLEIQFASDGTGSFTDAGYTMVKIG